MEAKQYAKLEEIVNHALDSAEHVWQEVGDQMTTFSAANESLVKKAAATQIPGYPVIEDGSPIVDDFICLVADMRNSTEHLLQELSSKTSKVNRLQRVYYETSALLPALAQVISWDKGAVTEYLGDGVLGIFKASPSSASAIYASYRAAKNCLKTVNKVVNPILTSRYQLPPIQIGVGMGYSRAVVTLVGLKSEYQQPKVFGECVFKATKLSGSSSVIVIDEAMQLKWPKAKGGAVKFTKKSIKNVLGYLVTE